MSENIICFAKDWFEDPTSNHHVMEHVAKHHRVLWLNSIGTRAPKLTSGRDVKKIFRKLKSFAEGPKKVGDNLWVYTPLVLPLPHQAWATKLNQQILRTTLRLLRLRLGMDDFQLWTFLPNVGDYVGTLGESLVVYYCVDEWSQFSYIDTEKTVAAERKLIERADVIFAVCHELAERKRKLNPATHLSTHGVDHEVFSRALDESLALPADVANLPGPVLGFYGTIQDWVDLDLIARLASRHPEWSIVLIGTAHVDTSKVERFSNVHLLGRKPHAELPAYCKAFDVGLIPYVITERMKFVNPIKLREYLCAGLPVVSTAVPEVTHYAEHCTVADDYDAFEDGVVRALAEDTPEKQQRRSEAMQRETWERKVQAVLQHVDEARAKK